MQSFWEITSDSYFEFIKKYVVGIGPWKDTIARPVKNYLTPPTDLVARAHAHDLQVCSLWSVLSTSLYAFFCWMVEIIVHTWDY